MLRIVPASLGGRHHGAHGLDQAFVFLLCKDKLILREQFQLCTFKRILDIYSSTPKTIDALMKLELPSGVEVEIKV